MSRYLMGFTGVLVIIALAVLFAAAMLRTDTPHAAAIAPARQVESLCVPVSVAVVGTSRIHVECLGGSSSFRFYAAPIGDPNTAEFVTMLTTAMSSIPTIELRIGYIDDTTSGPPFGCAENDCRKIDYIFLVLKPGAPLN